MSSCSYKEVHTQLCCGRPANQYVVSAVKYITSFSAAHLIQMAKVGRMRAAAAAGNKARRYGSTRSHSSSVNSERDMLGSSFRSLDTVKSELQEDGEFSCWDCCKASECSVPGGRPGQGVRFSQSSVDFLLKLYRKLQLVFLKQFSVISICQNLA